MFTEESRIIDVEYSEEMSKSYVDYAMSVITARAVPDIRDGLKPVQRRILYDMRNLGIDYDKPYRKSARIVGDTMGRMHPHGDSSIYEATVVLAQDFKKRVPLIDGHGNFGSIEGDDPAHMRYTEARLQKIANVALLQDLDKKVVDFIPNYDNSEMEPSVLPARIPNFLVNGSEGIAVGMVTNTPSHNLNEIIDAECALLDKPKMSIEDIMQFVQGPDWPTGGEIINKKDLLEIYKTGTGKIKVRAKIVHEKAKRKIDKDKLIITEIPPTMIGQGLPKFLSDLALLMENKTLTEVADVTNASDKEGIRIILELKKDADVDRVKNILYNKTKLEDTYSVNMLAIVGQDSKTIGKPEVVNLKSALEYHIQFLYEIYQRKYEYLLKKEESQKEILEGLIKAIDVIDTIIEILRGSNQLKDAKNCLMKGITDGIKFKTKTAEKRAKTLCFTENQTNAILEMRLQKLIGLELATLQNNYNTCLSKIDSYNKLLTNKTNMKKLIKKELMDIKKEYGEERKTTLLDAKLSEKIDTKQIIDVAFIMNRFGYIKTVELNNFEKNKENITEELKYTLPTRSDSKICVFTNLGNMYQIKVEQIPLCKMKDKGIPIENFIKKKSEDEYIVKILTIEEMNEQKLVFITKNGLGKKVDFNEFMTNMKVVAATKLLEDELIYVGVEKDIQLITHKGKTKKIKKNDIKELKKTARGNSLIKLKDDYIENVSQIEKI